MPTVSTVLVFLTPNPADAEMLSTLLAPTPLRVHHAAMLVQALELLSSTDARVLVAETQFRDGTWEDVLERVAQRPDLVIVLTAVRADERFWAEILNREVYDLILRSFHGAEFRRIVDNAVSFATRPRAQGAGGLKAWPLRSIGAPA